MTDDDGWNVAGEGGAGDPWSVAPETGARPVEAGSMPWGDVATKALTSIPSSGIEFAKNIVQPFIHPIDTATNLKNLAQGAMEKAGVMSTTGHERYADALGQFIRDRYGSVESFKKTLAEDPVGAAADISMIATGGGSALARAPGYIGRAGEIAAQAGRALDPVSNAARVAAPVARGAGAVAGHALGLTTGAGPIALESAVRSGYEGGQAAREFQENLRGLQPMSETVDEARQAVNNIRQARGQEYVRQMQALGANQTVYPGIWADVSNALRQASGVKTFKGVDLRPSTLEMRQNLADTIGAWYRRNPADYHTLEGFDALKQQVGDLKDAAPFGSPQRAQADMVYNAIRNAIVRADPQYGRIMNAYDQASHELREIERTLSLGKNRREGPSIDTSLRKLQSTLRDNVNTSFGRRRELLQFLLDNGAPHLLEKLAGQALSSGTPRGLSRLGVQLGTEMLAIAGGSALLHPGVAALGAAHLAMSSPRLVGEGAYYAGRAAHYINRAAGFATPRAAFQMGRLPAPVPRGIGEQDDQRRPLHVELYPGQQPPVRASGGRARAEAALPPGHQLGMRVPKGGSRCGNCRFLASDTTCGNPGFVKWNGSPKLPAPKNEYCCDLYEHGRRRAAGGRAMAAGGLPDDVGLEVPPDLPQTIGTHQEPSYEPGEASQQAAEAAAARVRAPYAKANERVSGLPDVGTAIGHKLVNAVMAGPTLMGQVAHGEVDPTSPEGIRKATDVVANTLGYGTLGAERGAFGVFGGMPIYSAAGEAVRNTRNQVLQPSQWLGYLKNQPGVKQAELEHIGLEDWLKGQHGPVSRDAVDQFVQSRQPQLTEVRKGMGWGPEQRALIDFQDKAIEKYGGLTEFWQKAPAAEQAEWESLSAKANAETQPGETKYSSYQLPGGSNYGETLLTLPEKGPMSYEDFVKSRGIEGQDEAAKRGAFYNYQMNEAPSPTFDNYKSSHWDEPNVLLHVRHNDRLIPDPNGPSTLKHPEIMSIDEERALPPEGTRGLNSLHLEEVQSDWHQAGRKQGYQGDPARRMDELSQEHAALNDVAAHGDASAQRRAWARQADIVHEMNTLSKGTVPDAPFKTTWPDLALKRMLHRAATERNPDGSYKYDALSWTPGEAQAARYPRSGSEKETQTHGMRQFYDKMLPDKANALVKKYGTRVERTNVPIRHTAAEQDRFHQEHGFQPEDKNQPVHLLRITPALRAAAEKGFPTFRAGGAVSGNWLKEMQHG